MRTGRKNLPAQPLPLSPREKEVISWVVRGKTNACIARRLGISRTTVKSHIESILQKLGAVNKTHAAVIAISRGIILPSSSKWRMHKAMPRVLSDSADHKKA